MIFWSFDQEMILEKMNCKIEIIIRNDLQTNCYFFYISWIIIP